MPRWLLVISLLAACGTRNTPAAPVEATPVEATPMGERTRLQPEPPREASKPSTAAPGAPGSAAAIEGLLRARHAADLPDRETLDHHPGPDEALVWLSEHGATASIRVRATRILGLYPERDHLQYLRGLAGPQAPHPTVRAAALDAIAAYPVSVRSGERDLLTTASQDDDPRVVAAARRALEDVEVAPERPAAD